MAVVSLFLFSAFVGVLILLALQWLFRYRKQVKEFSTLSGPPMLPLIGHSHILKPGGPEFLEQCISLTKQYGQNGAFIIWIGTIPMVVVHRADHLEQILTSTKHMDKSYPYIFLQPWLGTGLLTSTGDKWKSRRKMLTPAFHFQILNDFLEVFCEQTDTLLSHLAKHADSNTPFSVSPFMTHCALDIICQTAMGEKMGAQDHHDSDYVKAVYKMSEIINLRSRAPWQWWDPLFSLMKNGKDQAHSLSILHGFTDAVIQKRLAEVKVQVPQEETGEKTTKKKRLAFLDLLLHESDERGGTLSRKDIREEVDTFMFEGHDTTAAASTWAMYMIGCHLDVQARLHEEMDAIFQDSDRHPTMDDLKEMEYLECVIKETLRLYSSVPFFGRTTTEPCVIADCEVPKGTTITVFSYMLHRDENYFPDADKFDPDRFVQDEASSRHPFAYIPFSAGTRNCIGQKFAMMELKAELSAILRQFRWESTQTLDQLRVNSDLILRADNGIWLKMYRR